MVKFSYNVCVQKQLYKILTAKKKEGHLCHHEYIFYGFFVPKVILLDVNISVQKLPL